MSPLRFRAWDEQCNEMHYDFEWVSSGDEGNDWIIFRSDRQKLSSKPHPFENPYFRHQYKIMQSTGLKDKNEKEIFEGDICKLDDGEFNDPVGTIEWLSDSWVFENKCQGGCHEDSLFFFTCAGRLEIIGDIYENPELLTK